MTDHSETDTGDSTGDTGTDGTDSGTDEGEAGLTYAETGVDIEASEDATAALIGAVGEFEGDYAGLVDIGDSYLALATDGVGIPGLLQTWDFHERERPVTIHAPAGTRSKLEDIVAVSGDRPTYPVRIRQVTAGDVVLDRTEYEVRAFDVDHQTRALGYALVEDERKGRFDREKAEEELGIPPGPKYSKLHAGESIEHDGRTVQPEEVVGPPRPGRRLVYTGDTRPTETTLEAAEGADLLVHDGTFGDDHRQRARETAHSTAREAATVAREAGAKRLALMHISTRYAGHAWQLEEQASEVFEPVVVAEDGMCIDVPFPDSGEDWTIEHL